MTSTTDKQVLDLINLAKTKKSEIAKAEKPDWKTNCSFGYNPESSQRTNIQTVADVEVLISILAFLLIQKDGHENASVLLDVPSKFKWMGFTLEDWQADLKSRVNKIQISKKRKELDALEERLNKLISPELRTKIELEEITAGLLGGD